MLLQQFVERVRTGQTLSSQAIAETLRAIAEREPQLRAWAHVAPAEPLLAHAEAVDTRLPLAGVPFGVKDIIDVAGMPTRYGSSVTPADPRPYDAACVDMLRRAGAIPIGKTVTAEFAYKAPGLTVNPHDPGHTPGGSSSGSAAAVAAGMVPLALGTQTGGSMIRPAAYCGVVGFKPSFGLVPRDGMKITCESLDVIGWYAATVEDVMYAASVLLPDPTRAAAPSGPMRVVIIPGATVAPLQPEAAQALQQATEALRQAGHEIRIMDAFTQAQRILQAHATIMEYELSRNIAPVARVHSEGLSDFLTSTVARGLRIDAATYREARRFQAEMQQGWCALLGDADLVMTASAPGAAPAGLASTGDAVFNKIWSVLGWPCLHLPFMVKPDTNLPVGVQLIGRFGKDVQFLSIAALVRDVLREQGPPRLVA